MQSFDILEPNLNVFQSRFLEASAGTGKTFTIEHLFVRLLLESKEPIQLSEILAVTFTKEATYEMKSRIHEKLKALKEQKNPRVLEALACFEEIQVFTIHSFCQRMLTEYAFEAKVSFSSGLQDHFTGMRQTQMRQVIQDFFQTGNEKYALEISSLLKRMRYDLERFIHAIMETMQKEPRPKPYIFPELPHFSLQQLLQEVSFLSSQHKRIKFEKYEKQVQKLAQYLEKKDPTILLEEKTWFFEKFTAEKGFFHILQTTLLPPLQIFRDPAEMLLRLAKECKERWEVKARREEYFTFDDIVKKMEKALSSSQFLEKVRKKYKAVIVDEFQDTDPTQWQIFKKLFLQTHLLFLVGDPKQSIYGFRSADIHTYIKARKAFAVSSKATLDTNFRSSPKLVSALNRLFTRNPAWIALPSLPDALIYHPVKAGRIDCKLEEDPIVFFGIKMESKRSVSNSNIPTKTMEEKMLFPYIAKEILRLKKHFAFRDFLVLIKDQFQARRLQNFFQHLRIPSTIKKTFHIAKSRGFLAMEMLLRAVAYPENKGYVQAVCKGPLMDISLIEKKEISFFSLQKFFYEKGFAAFFTYFLENYFTTHSDRQLYFEFCQIAELLMQSHTLQLTELLYLMQEWRQISPEEEEKLRLRGEEGEDKVAIMTTFASKGLEFEVVFALGMASRHKGEKSSLEKEGEKMRQLYVAFTRAKEKLYIPYLEEQMQETSSSAASPVELFLKNSNIQMDWSIEKPIEWPIEWIEEKISLSPYVTSEKTYVLKPALEASFHFPIETLSSFSSMKKSSAETSLESLVTKQFLLQDFTQKTPHTLPIGVETGTIFHTLFEKFFEDRTIPYEEIIYKTLGSTHLEGWEKVVCQMMRDVFEMPLLENFSLSQLREGEYLQEMEFLFLEENIPIPIQKLGFDSVGYFSNFSLASRSVSINTEARLNQKNLRASWSKYQFLNWNGYTWRKGFIDLVFQRGDVFYLLDWKTNWLGPSEDFYTQEHLELAMQENEYYLQAKLYRQALMRYVKALYKNPQFGGAFYIFLRGRKGIYIGNC